MCITVFILLVKKEAENKNAERKSELKESTKINMLQNERSEGMKEIVLVVVFIIGIAVGCASDESAKKKIRNVDKRLTDFERKFYGEIPEEERFADYTKDFEYERLALMPSRLCRLESCYRCTLYRDKAREDRQGKFFSRF